MRYKASLLNAEGKRLTRIEDRTDPLAWSRELSESGLTVLAIRSDTGVSTIWERLQAAGGRGARKEAFLTELGLLLDTGLGLLPCLAIMAQSLSSPRDRRTIETAMREIQEGVSFAESLARQDLFSEAELALLRTGESTGEFKEMVHVLSRHIRGANETKRQLITLLIYPSFLILMAGSVFTFLAFRVLPELVQVFSEMGSRLPPFTASVLHTINALKTTAPVLVPLLALAGLGGALWVRGHRKAFDRGLLRIPLMGSLIRRWNLLTFCPSLALLLEKKIPPVEISQRLLKHFKSNLLVSQLLEEMATEVTRGEALTGALVRSPLFSKRERELLRVGEKASRLPEMLHAIEGQSRAELETGIKRLLGVLEPALILAIGALVLFFVVAFILPLFQLDYGA